MHHQKLSLLLQNPVNKKQIEDYGNFVKPEDEMWVKKINGKLTKSQYTSHKQFKADIHQLMRNAQVYNAAFGGGVCAYPGMNEWNSRPCRHDIIAHCINATSCFRLFILHWKLNCHSTRSYKGCVALQRQQLLHRPYMTIVLLDWTLMLTKYKRLSRGSSRRVQFKRAHRVQPTHMARSCEWPCFSIA